MLVGIFLLWLMYFSSIFMSLGDSYGGGTLNSIFESDFWIFSDSFLCLLFFVFLIFILYYYLYYNNINNSIRLIVIYISQYFQNEYLENSKIKKTAETSIYYFYFMRFFSLFLVFFFIYNKYYYNIYYNIFVFIIIIVKIFFNIQLNWKFQIKFLTSVEISKNSFKKTIFLILSNLTIFFYLLIISFFFYQIYLLY